jgi:hypothetical protein
MARGDAAHVEVIFGDVDLRAGTTQAREVGLEVRRLRLRASLTTLASSVSRPAWVRSAPTCRASASVRESADGLPMMNKARVIQTFEKRGSNGERDASTVPSAARRQHRAQEEETPE